MFESLFFSSSSLVSSRLLAASVELAVLAAVVGLGMRLLRIRTPRIVALLWLVVMIKPLVSLCAGPLVPDLTVPLLSASPVVSQKLDVEAPAGIFTRMSTKTPPALVKLSSGVSLRHVPSALVLAWIAGVGVFVAIAIWDRLRLRGIVKAAHPAPPSLQARLEAAASRLGLRRPPALLVTEALESPALAGTVRPVILLPAWLVEEGTSRQIDWALGHELVHQKMLDPLASAVRSLLRILFFFHPLAWWVGNRWEEAAERACDRALVSSREEAACYAERLYEMLAKAAARRRVALASGLFATRTQIGQRIAALLRDPLKTPPHLTLPRMIGLGLFAVLCLAVGTGFADVLAEKGTGEKGIGEVELELSEDGWSVRLELEGTWEFTADGTDVESLGPDSFLILEQLRGGPMRRLEIRGRPDGSLERIYRVDGRTQELDEEGRDWVEETLPRFVKHIR
jgi:beta-lactamase regulating signal transducer with metallopeptidase domain